MKIERHYPDYSAAVGVRGGSFLLSLHDRVQNQSHSPYCTVYLNSSSRGIPNVRRGWEKSIDRWASTSALISAISDIRHRHLLFRYRNKKCWLKSFHSDIGRVPISTSTSILIFGLNQYRIFRYLKLIIS